MAYNNFDSDANYSDISLSNDLFIYFYLFIKTLHSLLKMLNFGQYV